MKFIVHIPESYAEVMRNKYLVDESIANAFTPSTGTKIAFACVFVASVVAWIVR